jgi:type II secretion system protein G
MTRRNGNKGFTLIELLIVVAIIGIIAAIAIPNLLNAIQRGKQKRTMSDMRAIGTAAESYQVDNGYVPNLSGLSPVVGKTDPARAQYHLEPVFIRNMPTLDGWKRDIYYGYDSANQTYTILSYAKNGSADTATGGAMTDFSDDIYFLNGSFWQYPEGTQK